MCELTPSGTTPIRLMRVPPMFSTTLVMGDTVLTTLSVAVEVEGDDAGGSVGTGGGAAAGEQATKTVAASNSRMPDSLANMVIDL